MTDAECARARERFYQLWESVWSLRKVFFLFSFFFFPLSPLFPLFFPFLSSLSFYTHTHARTHARAHARTHARTRARTHARTHARTRARTHDARAQYTHVPHARKKMHAWNVDASSSDSYADVSWIKRWEMATGLERARCSFDDCTRRAEVGGHVWIKQNGVYIAPLSSRLNVRNADCGGYCFDAFLVFLERSGTS